MIVLSDMVKDIIFSDGYKAAEKVLLLKKLIVPELKVDAYTERLAKLCDADKERARERAERRREQNRQAQQRYRESHDMASSPVSKVSDSKQCNQESSEVSNSKQCKRRTDTDTVTEDNTIKDINRPDTDACARGGQGKKCVVPSWTMDDGRLMSGEFPTVTILRDALGRGCWRAAIDQLGEATVLGEFGAFRAEIRAGEIVENPAAAFTARLKKLGFKAGRRKQGFSGVNGSVQR